MSVVLTADLIGGISSNDEHRWWIADRGWAIDWNKQLPWASDPDVLVGAHSP